MKESFIIVENNYIKIKNILQEQCFFLLLCARWNYTTKTSQVLARYFRKSTSGSKYKKNGTAWAKVDYAFYNKLVSSSGQSGTYIKSPVLVMEK